MTTSSFSWLDWLVLAVYGVGMMLIGVFYSRVKSVEEYLLGGRKMKPWAVGISLYATLMSTLTYLALPGEMISHGPLFLGAMFSYPLIYLVVSRLIIPVIMRLRVTSAYEILELRFGLSVRMLGSTYFLLLRLMWMSMIVYATTTEVLVPLLHLDPASTPWVCIVLAVITIAYTSMGGLQAVVFTDVVQATIMVMGALLSLALITYALGGVSKWFPTSWSPHWDRPTLFDPSARIPWGVAILSQFTWYICTTGSIRWRFSVTWPRAMRRLRDGCLRFRSHSKFLWCRCLLAWDWRCSLTSRRTRACCRMALILQPAPTSCCRNSSCACCRRESAGS
jgi:SSS family solute:Na+ symporter